MRRKLTAAIFTVSTLTSGLVSALGLGEATVRSSLNQPLNAEIELVNVAELTEQEIITALASREEFLRADVERVYFLSDLRFKVERSQRGNAIIRVTSSRPVREPFLNFLVEVTWPTGRLLREYALLIDPPTFSQERTPSVSASSSAAATSSAPAPRAAATQGGGSRVPDAATPARTGGVGEYGPTGRNDTLWSIAMQTRPDPSITPQQMMLAIQRLNPEAFIDGNINRLKAGQVLRIPNTDEARVVDSRRAVADVSAQNRAFASDQAPVARVDARRDIADQGPVATREDGMLRRDELRIVVDSEGAQERPSGTVSGAEAGGRGGAQAAIAMEQLDQAERENTELKGRVEDLESQLETLQRLLALKDDQLAALQGTVDPDDGSVAAEGISGTLGDEAAMPDESMTDPSAVAVEELEVPEPGEAAVSSGDGASQEGQSAADEPTQAEAADSAAAAVAGDPAFVEERPSIKSPEPEVQEAPKESWVDMIKNNVVYQIALGAGAIVLLLILWMLSRNSARKESEYLEKQGGAAGDDDLVSGLSFDDDEEGDQLAATTEDSESDPISEAEVYITYQRYDQAAKVLKEALEKEPDNHSARLKLMEVAGEEGDKELFDSSAAVLLGLGDAATSDEVDRLKAQYADAFTDSSLSLDDLESQLMGGAGPDAIETVPDATQVPDDAVGMSDTVEDDNLDIDFDLGEIEVDDERDRDDLDKGFEEPALEGSDDALQEAIDTVEDELGGQLEDLPDAADSELDATLEQGLDSEFNLDTVEVADDLDLSIDEKDDGLGLDLDDSPEPDSGSFEISDEFKALEEDASDTPVAPEVTADEDLSLELDDSDLDISLDDVEQMSSELDDALAELDDDADSGLDEAVSEDLTDEAVALSEADSTGDADDFVEDMEEDFDFLSGTDEAATKLDLARAYIEMGDKDGARDILEEVAEEGSDEQKDEANKLLQDL